VISRAWPGATFDNKLVIASATAPAHTVIFIAKIPKALRGYVRASTREFGPQSERIADKM
jgi:hypothetical protein